MCESDLLFFSSSASFQGYLHPYGSTENDRKRCSSYSRPIGGAWHSQKWRRRDGACAKSLHAVNKQAVEEETEHKKKTKMASARKPESFVWTNNEVKLLLWLTLNYKASKLQERGFRGRRVGRWCHRFGKYPHENARVLDFSTLRPFFKKVCFQALRLQDPWGCVSCPWTLRHVDQGNQTSDLLIARCWLYP